MDGITYMTVMSAARFDRYPNPKAFDDAVDVAVTCAKLAASPTASSAHEESESGLKIYHQLDPQTDAHVARLASAPVNDAQNRFSHGRATERNDKFDETRLKMSQICWNPTATHADPQHELLLRKVKEGVRPFLCEGFKSEIGQELVIGDSDPCPFHVRPGVEVPSFKDCCKAKYQERKEKGDAKRKPLYYAMVSLSLRIC